jgi:glycine oxidase
MMPAPRRPYPALRRAQAHARHAAVHGKHGRIDNEAMTASRAIWRDQLAAAERAALARGMGVISEPRPDVLVVGGGIVGAATAVACYEAGLGSVLLIESGQLGSGATGGAGGLLTPEIREWSDPGPFVDLARASLGHWKDLELSRPGGVGLLPLDWIGLVPDPESFALHQLPAVEWLMPDQVRDFVPGLATPMAGAMIRDQARVNPLRALARLTAVLPDVATGVAAISATVRGGRVVTVGTSAGDIQPGAVVFATGRPPILDGLPLDIPSDLVKGHLLVTEPVSVRLPGTVAPVATQLEDGRLLVGGTFDTGDESPSVRPGVIGAILDGLYSALPALRGVGASHQWCCFRPCHPDGHPVVDRMPGVSNAWLTSGHFRSGILMAPVTARVITRWISAGEPPAVAPALSSTRFAGHPHRGGRPA